MRVITASNTDLARLAELGQFRKDLLFRLKILHLELPPLRERQADVRLLAEHFILIYSTPAGQPIKALHPETLAWMETYSWPGNIRELENLVHRELLLSEGSEICIQPLAPAQGERRSLDRRRSWSAGLDYNQAKARALADFEKGYLLSLLGEAHGNVTLAAKMAHKERRALGKLLKKHRIDRSQYH